MIQQFRIYLYVVVILGGLTFLYFWHYRPIGQLEEAKKELKEKEIIIDLSQFETKKEVFEEKHKAVKETLQDQKKGVQDEINTSVGDHVIIIR